MSRAARLSTRIDEEVARRLEARSERLDTNKSRLAERYIDEGMRMDEHPGIVFRDGPAGRRAALVGGPDVWEVIEVIRESGKHGPAAARHAAGWLDLPLERIQTAVGYYSAHPAEIDRRIQRNSERAQTVAAQLWSQQTALA